MLYVLNVINPIFTALISLTLWPLAPNFRLTKINRIND